MEYIYDVLFRIRRFFTVLANTFCFSMEYTDEVLFRMRIFFTVVTNTFCFLMEYIDEVSFKMRKFFTVVKNTFCFYMEYIDEVSFRMRRFFTVVAINLIFFELLSRSRCLVVSALSKTIWSGLNSSHQVWNQLAIYQSTSGSWVKSVGLFFIRHISFLESLLKDLKLNE